MGQSPMPLVDNLGPFFKKVLRPPEARSPFQILFLILISDKNLEPQTTLLYQWGRGPMRVTESYRTFE